MYKLNPSFYLRRMANAENIQDWMKANNGLLWFVTNRYSIICKQYIDRISGHATKP